MICTTPSTGVATTAPLLLLALTERERGERRREQSGSRLNQSLSAQCVFLMSKVSLSVDGSKWRRIESTSQSAGEECRRARRTASWLAPTRQMDTRAHRTGRNVEIGQRQCTATENMLSGRGRVPGDRGIAPHGAAP